MTWTFRTTPHFCAWRTSLLTGQSPHAFDSDDLVDGGGDKQIDIITITEHVDSADVYVIQGKNTNTFSSNALVQMSNGLSWLFEKPRAEIKTLGNHACRTRSSSIDRSKAPWVQAISVYMWRS